MLKQGVIRMHNIDYCIFFKLNIFDESVDPFK